MAFYLPGPEEINIPFNGGKSNTGLGYLVGNSRFPFGLVGAAAVFVKYPRVVCPIYFVHCNRLASILCAEKTWLARN